MKKRVLKPFVKPMAYLAGGLLLVLSFALMQITTDEGLSTIDDNYEYVNSSIFTNNIPVAKQEKDAVILKPYTLDKVEISKKFYDSKATDEEKENALIYYNDTYMQNSGILYKSEESFDVISILDGTVIDVKKDEVLGNVVEIKHTNNLISTYEGLSTVNVKKGQLLKQGDVLGKIEFKSGEEVILEKKLVAEKDIEKSTMWNITTDLYLKWFNMCR